MDGFHCIHHFHGSKIPAPSHVPHNRSNVAELSGQDFAQSKEFISVEDFVGWVFLNGETGEPDVYATISERSLQIATDLMRDSVLEFQLM